MPSLSANQLSVILPCSDNAGYDIDIECSYRRAIFPVASFTTTTRILQFVVFSCKREQQQPQLTPEPTKSKFEIFLSKPHWDYKI